MPKTFNINGACKPDRHYMVSLRSRLEAIRAMIDKGEYFTINKARQYGKTTTLQALARYLKNDYEVVSLDFQRISSLSFESEQLFVAAFSEELLFFVTKFPPIILYPHCMNSARKTGNLLTISQTGTEENKTPPSLMDYF